MSASLTSVVLFKFLLTFIKFGSSFAKNITKLIYDSLIGFTFKDKRDGKLFEPTVFAMFPAKFLKIRHFFVGIGIKNVLRPNCLV